MTDFQDHFEDMDEEIGEFTDDLTERLEELFGFEVEVQQVEAQRQHSRYHVRIDPVGAAETLSEELDTDVETGGPLSFYVDT